MVVLKTRYTKVAPWVSTLSALMATAAAPVWAQDQSDVYDLGEIIILNTEDATGPVDGEVDPITATGSKIPIRLNTVPQSVSVLGREEIEAFGASTVSEALRYTAGVTADVFGDDNDYDWLRVRGFQADQTGIYLDNAQNLTFAFGSFYIDPYTLERIEVLRGPASALYGGSNPGGIINYISKRAGENIGEITVGVNDAGAGWVAFDYGQMLDEERAYRLTGRVEGGEKYDDFNSGWRGTLAGSYKFATQQGTEVTLLANLHKADEQHNGSTFLPYFGTVEATQQFGFIDPDANFSDPDWDKYRRDQASASLIIEHEFDNGFTLTGISRIAYADVNERYYYPFGYETTGFPPPTTPVDGVGTLNLIAFEHESKARTAQTDIRYYGSIDTGAARHELLFGLDVRYYRLDEQQASGSGTNTVVNPTNPGVPTTFVYQDAKSTQDQIGLYFQDQIHWGGGWIGTVNLRHDWVSTDQDGSGAFERDDREFSYRAALAYEFENGFTPYLNYSSFFNPLITSPANGVTEPETGNQIELGFKWAPIGGNFFFGGAAFQIVQENVVTGTFPNFDQLGEVTVTGLELEGSYDFGNGLRMRGAATYLDTETTEDSDSTLVGNTPTLIPDLEIALIGEYAFENGLTLGAGARYRGESFADDANTLTVPSSTIYDAFATYEFDNGLLATLAVTNLADDRYVTGCQSVYVCSYGAGREATFSVTKRF